MGTRYTFISEDNISAIHPSLLMCLEDMDVRYTGDIVYSMTEGKYWGFFYDGLALSLSLTEPYDADGDGLIYIVELCETGAVSRIEFKWADKHTVIWERQELSVPNLRY